MPNLSSEDVRGLKTHLEALEKLRNLEKDARTRLQKEGLTLDEQTRWATILASTSNALKKVEEELVKVLDKVGK